MDEFAVFALPALAGVLALSPLPGRRGDFSGDLAQVLGWGPSLVLTMVTAPELAQAGAAGLGDDLGRAGVEWRHLPVPDFGVPGPEVNAAWPEAAATALAVLAGGGRVLVHCHGGCGRSGMAALRVLIAGGLPQDQALARLRQARPCAVETEPQMAWAGQG
jgi:protein-tyrosine phosphatase